MPCLSVVVQYMIMAACCCLCRDPVSTDHRRRKKLHGASCTTARTVLREVSSVPLEALVETRDQSAVLCYSCEKILNNIQSLTAKVETLRADVRGKVSALQILKNLMTGSISMLQNYFHLGYCGMDFTMPFGRGMGREYSATGRSC